MSDDRSFHPYLTDAEAFQHYQGLRGLWRSLAVGVGIGLGDLPRPVPLSFLQRGIVVSFAANSRQPGHFYASSVLSPWGVTRIKSALGGAARVEMDTFWNVLGQVGIAGQAIPGGPDDNRAYSLTAMGDSPLPAAERAETPDAAMSDLLKVQWERIHTIESVPVPRAS